MRCDSRADIGRYTWIVTLLFVFSLVLAAETATAKSFPVGYSVAFPNGTTVMNCVDAEEEETGFEVMERTSFDLLWSDPDAEGHDLCRINGYGDPLAGTSCSITNQFWNFYLIDDGAYVKSPVTYDGNGNCWNGKFTASGQKYCARQGDVIGLAYGVTGTKPPRYTFRDSCAYLDFKEVEVFVDDDKSSADEDGGRIKDVKPGSVVKFDITLESLFEDTDDAYDLEDIEVRITIADIDDGDELEEEADAFDLSPEKEKPVTLEFAIPTDAEDDSYEVLLEIEGEAENGIIHERNLSFDLEVEKETHEVIFSEALLDDASLMCDQSTELEMELVNIGQNDEEIVLTVTNDDLGIAYEDNFTLEEGDDNTYARSIAIRVPQTIPSGTYPLVLRASYEDDDEVATETVELSVTCTEQETEEPEEESADEPENNDDEETYNEEPESGQSSEDTNPQGGVPEVVGTTPTQTVSMPSGDLPLLSVGEFKQNWFSITMLFLTVLLVIVVVVLLIALSRRK
ncbi:hypothetical protein HYW21_06395 [Candidatus Woesearchaeota archaeon]|nr:hypothetical protein [Candidatus Woesearchaeota archaeon]